MAKFSLVTDLWVAWHLDHSVSWLATRNVLLVRGRSTHGTYRVPGCSQRRSAHRSVSYSSTVRCGTGTDIPGCLCARRRTPNGWCWDAGDTLRSVGQRGRVENCKRPERLQAVGLPGAHWTLGQAEVGAAAVEASRPLAPNTWNRSVCCGSRSHENLNHHKTQRLSQDTESVLCSCGGRTRRLIYIYKNFKIFHMCCFNFFYFGLNITFYYHFNPVLRPG
jgi:hypothetical protein